MSLARAGAPHEFNFRGPWLEIHLNCPSASVPKQRRDLLHTSQQIFLLGKHLLAPLQLTYGYRSRRPDPAGVTLHQLCGVMFPNLAPPSNAVLCERMVRLVKIRGW